MLDAPVRVAGGPAGRSGLRRWVRRPRNPAAVAGCVAGFVSPRASAEADEAWEQPLRCGSGFPPGTSLVEWSS